MTEGKSTPNPAAISESDLARRFEEVNQLYAVVEHKVVTISALAIQAEHGAIQVADQLQASTAGLEDLKSMQSAIAAIGTEVRAVKSQISDEQAVIASKSSHIQGAQEHADKVRADLDRALTAASQQATEAEGLKSRAQSAADTAAALLADVRAAKKSSETEAAAATASEYEATEAAKSTKALAATAASIEERIAQYEEQLARFKKESEEQLAMIVSLLPGATSAGLAHAFDQRRKSFMQPSVRWQRLFVGSLAVLVCLALSGLWNVYTAAAPLTYDELVRLWLARLPVAGALIWLALYASRESALAKRLEEDYGYKSAIAASFQGFQKQMSEIGDQTGPDTPLAKLCADTLATIASPPGRIYDKHKLVVTPSAEILDSMKAVVDTAGSRGNVGKGTG